MDRRSVQTVFGGSTRMMSKTSPAVVTTGSARECMMTAAAKIPGNYVPPPEGVILNAVPYKWPSDEEWSRAYIWDPASQ